VSFPVWVATMVDLPQIARLGGVAYAEPFGHRLGQLVRAGRAEAGNPGVLDRLDRAFLADRSPAHGTSF
jgi:hypothetical protein